MEQIWEAHTVVAKSLRTIQFGGIRRIGPQQGLFLNPLSWFRSKADTRLPACALGQG